MPETTPQLTESEIKELYARLYALPTESILRRDGLAVIKENAALREQLAQAKEQEQILQEQVTRLAALAETRSDIIAAKAAHVDDLESRLAQAIRDRDEARKQRRELSGDVLGGL